MNIENVPGSIGLRASELRHKLGMSQEKFAYSIGMARTYYAEFEAGKRNISVKNLYRIVNGFDMSFQEFFASQHFSK